MASVQQQYTSEMKKKFGYYATWNPGVPLKLGDIGIFKKNVFTRVAGLQDFNISFDIRPDDTKTPLEYNSSGNVTVTTKLSGTVAPQGSVLNNLDAGIIVEFGKEKSTLFKANNTTTPSIQNTIRLGEQIIELFKAGKWDKNWVVITELVEAENSTIIISNTTNGKIELKANADIGAANFDIANGKFEFSPQFSRGLETKIISAEGLTPLFKAMGLKTRLLAPPIFKTQAFQPLDTVTPDSAKNEHRDTLYFGEITDLDEEVE